MANKWDSDISVDTKELTTQFMKLKNVKNGAVKAVTRGLNVAAAKMKSTAKEPIRNEYLITKMASVTKSFKVDKASYANMSAAFKSNGRPVALSYFVYSRNRFPGVKGAPTTLAVVKKRGGGYTGGFVAGVQWHSENGDAGVHKGIFRRVGKERYPIEQLYGPSATELLNNEAVRARVDEIAVTAFDKEFNRQVNYLFKGGK